MREIGALGTETVNPAWQELDRMPVGQLVDVMLDENARMVERLRRERDAIAAAIEKISERYRRGGRIVYAGAGTSGRLGVLDASECPPTFGVSPEAVKGIIAGGYSALTNAAERVEDSPEAGASDTGALCLTENDTLVAISASGRTPYCLGAIQKAKEASALTVAVCCNKNSEMGAAADLAIEVETGPEVIAGSTRLKAGSAQKAVLNMISSITMIRAGKVYKNLMVDMRATNEKLMDRSVRIFQTAAGVEDRAAAEEKLRAAGGVVKTAIVMELCRTDAETAGRLLRENGGFVRAAVEQGNAPRG